jgi:hypothetical protein
MGRELHLASICPRDQIGTLLLYLIRPCFK